MKANLTIAVIQALVGAIPDMPQWLYFVVAHPRYEEMVKRCVPTARIGHPALVGIECYVKRDQVADLWMFSDHKTLEQYLSGELSELDLMGLIETGSCLPKYDPASDSKT